MSLSIKIHPSSRSLEMYGDPDCSAAYSLSGHVSLTLSSSFSFFERRSAVRLLLRSLTIVFEGQSELISQDVGYVPYRLCRVSQDLVLGEPVELTNDGFEDATKPCTWNVVFNLTIPGWLPATTAFGDVDTDEAGTRYALYATAKFQDIDDNSTRSWLSSLCSSFQSHLRSVKARKCPMRLDRFVTPAGSIMSSSTIQQNNFSVVADSPADDSRIPADVLSKLCVMASVPDYVDITGSDIPICLRLRAEGLASAEMKRLRVIGFNVEVEQTERYTPVASSCYTSSYPVPRASEQPPNKPLLSSHPMQAFLDLSMAKDSVGRVCVRSFSLVPPDDEARHYTLAGDGYVFAQAQASAPADGSCSWFSIHTKIPFVQNPDVCVPANYEGAYGGFRVRESADSPLFRVNHRLYVSIACTYDLTEGENPVRAKEMLRFHVPLRFARVYSPAPAVSCVGTPSSTPGHSPASSVDSIPFPLNNILPTPSLPYAQTLPAYSQLFDSNGDRKIDYSVPLPLYTPRCQSLIGEEGNPAKDDP